MSDDNALAALLDRAGVVHHYRDGLGQWRDTPEAARRAILTAMGWHPGGAGSPPECLARIEAAGWLQPLPPVLVATEHAEGHAVPVRLPASDWPDALEWRLDAESGAVHAGSVAPADIEVDERRDLDPEPVEQRVIGGLPSLPPGYHRFTLREPAATMTLIVAPSACFVPDCIRHDARLTGLAIQIPTLRSARNWGIGDYTDLRRLGEIAADRAVDFVGITPVHAATLADPGECSPYAASSRLWLNTLLLDPERIADYAACEAARTHVEAPEFQARLERLRALPEVDYRAVAEAKAPVLRLLHAHFERHQLTAGSGRGREYLDFVERSGDDLAGFAWFEAARGARRGPDGVLLPWTRWPARDRPPREQGRPAGAATGFECYLQWQADLQLRDAAAAMRDRGMRLGLYRDLALGPAEDGAEAWARQDVIAPGVSAGAPADDFNARGQNWRVPVWDPARLRAAAYAPFIDLLRANMRHAGALRIDHVMGLDRLFWIPAGSDGRDGAYVRQARDDLLGIVALESHRQRCLVIGEDLGTVPDGFREALADADLLSYRVFLFEREHDGAYRAPEHYPRAALVAPSTHDLPTLAGFWLGRDVETRARLGMYHDADEYERAHGERAHARYRLLEFLGRCGQPVEAADPSHPEHLPEGLVLAVHRALARVPASLLQLQLDDVLEAPDAVNLPGTWHEYPNWQRKIPVDIENLADDPRFAATFPLQRGIGNRRGVKINWRFASNRNQQGTSR